MILESLACGFCDPEWADSSKHCFAYGRLGGPQLQCQYKRKLLEGKICKVIGEI
jgi:hypothetical protein